VQRSPLLLAVVVLAACGGSSKTATTTSAAPAPAPPPGKVLYAGGDWVVSIANGAATAYHRVGGTWRADRSGRVKIAVLGPKRGGKAAAIPQVAVELSAPKPLVESGLWVDGRELQVKGGGLTPTRGTIYGAPPARLGRGTHTAVAYGRTDGTGSAVLWTFRV
jgi:hypothetical protein